ncbi:Rieske 2Fe-2S domain-containing protein [Candidatus Marinimicrobia bacterium]|jgi:Rieske Fe-S protein|nr:Rieske 2Fe-2S domain-containing protein [Candidatus Neomarinimicrobiota bacterium]|tara:strand:- start:236 stop:700 length:465 start_codon:yes stop_codon:yes gene_type:complete
MNRRNFIKKSSFAACACVGVSALGLLQSCEDNTAYEQNTDNDGDNDIQLSVDISQDPHRNLEVVGGTSVLGPNEIDSKGLLLVRTSEDNFKVLSRRCTHSSYSVNDFNSQGLAMCSSGHGGGFNANGNVVSGPPSASLSSYSSSFSNNILIISK